MGGEESNSNINTNLSTNINPNINENDHSNLLNNQNSINTSNINSLVGSNMNNKTITTKNSINENNVITFIWIDYNIDNEENKKYKNILKTDVSLIECKLIEQGLEEIKKIKFERVILMLSSKMFEDFIPLFEKEKNKISCSLNIIVFTKKEKKILIEEICSKNKEISSGYLFDKVNIFAQFKQIQEFIQKEKNKKKLYSSHFELIDDKNRVYYDNKMECFQKIENYEELILPIYFHRIIETITLEEIHNFNYYLVTSFEETKTILSQFENLPEMPVEIICKYWAKIYTLEKGKFYSILNRGLRDKKFKLFLPFVKMMYEGIKRKVFTPITNELLYSGGIISNKELQELRNSLANNINNNELPNVIYYFKSFKSFSKKKKIAMKFMKNATQDCSLLLFIVGTNNIEGEFISNAYIKDFSQFAKEDEVLFFPFSSFEVEKIEDEGNHVNIYLKYLGRYKSLIEEKKSIDILFKDIPLNQFGKDISEMGLIKYKFCKFWEVEREIKINGNANCILVFNQTIILISIGDTLQLYNSENNMNILTFHIHSHDIKDLLKINENIFISSSKDKTIKFTKLEENYSKFTVIKSIEIHQEEINQTIKLRKDNLFASCSNDNSIKIWQFDFSDDKNNVVVNNSSYHDTKILSICELPNSNIISISEEGFLIFWEYHEKKKKKETILIGFKNSLHNCIFLFKENIILIGTKKAVIFIDIIKKEKIKKIDLQYNAYSIYYFNDAIFLGLKNNWNSCQLIEYELKKNIEEINYGKGCDKCLEISTIYQLNKKKIATCNKNNYIKIWKESENKPKNLFFENNPINYLQDGYESDNEININNIPGNENQMGIEGEMTLQSEKIKHL